MDVGTAVESWCSAAHLREAAQAGVLDSDTLASVEAAIARTGLPDPLPFIVSATRSSSQSRWQRAAPHGLASSTRLHYMLMSVVS